LNPAANIDSSLIRRDGIHAAVIYGGMYCSGVSVFSKASFGCGGECYSFTNGTSILLTKDTESDLKASPTASLFADSSCQDIMRSAGILSKNHAACTSLESTEQLFNSVYLYYNC
jgi:hypothetical protein